MKKIYKRYGFTLIELTIYIGLLGILIAVMSQVFVATLSVKLDSEGNAFVVQDGNYILNRINYDIHRASRIISPTIGQTGSGLSLGIIENGVERVYQYTLSNQSLTLSDGITTDAVHGGSTLISNFQVTRVGNSLSVPDAKDTVQVIFTVASNYVVSSGVQQMTFQTTEGLR